MIGYQQCSPKATRAQFAETFNDPGSKDNARSRLEVETCISLDSQRSEGQAFYAEGV